MLKTKYIVSHGINFTFMFICIGVMALCEIMSTKSCSVENSKKTTAECAFYTRLYAYSVAGLVISMLISMGICTIIVASKDSECEEDERTPLKQPSEVELYNKL
jgi:hypothetical protein